MEGMPVLNKRPTTNPLQVSLADEHTVTSSHECDIIIDSLPVTLTGHIIPGLKNALLFGIRVLTKAACKVTFDQNKCIVSYKGSIILQGTKDWITDLWTLPILSNSMPSCYGETITLLVAPVVANAHAQNFACFTHTVQNKVNRIRFAHQLLCSSHISTLLKAIRRGFLKGCPNLMLTVGVTKYLNPSPAMAKRHMKQPRMEIQSTQCIVVHAPIKANAAPEPIKANLPPTDIEVLSHDSSISNVVHPPNANLIKDGDTSLYTNVFCFACWQNNRHIMQWPFSPYVPWGQCVFPHCISLQTNAVLALQIKEFCDAIIFEAYNNNSGCFNQRGTKLNLTSWIIRQRRSSNISHCTRMRLTLSQAPQPPSQCS